MAESHDFNSYRVSILNDIKRLGDGLSKIQDMVMAIAIEIERIKVTEKVRSAIWGATGGLIMAAFVGAMMRKLLP